MRKLLAVLTLMALLPLSAGVLSGCAGKGEDEILEHDAKVSETKRAEYEKTMKEQMQKNIPKGKGPKR
jgi:hypothetical protein